MVYYKLDDKKDLVGLGAYAVESLKSVFTLGEVVLNDPEDAAFLE